MNTVNNDEIKTYLNNSDLVPSPENFVKSAYIQSSEEYEKLCQDSISSQEDFWAKMSEQLHWFQPWSKIFEEGEEARFKWFVDGKTNACFNCIDRHLSTKSKKVAIYWEGEPGDKRCITYRELFDEVTKVADSLLKLGITKKDVVTLYMPMVPELTFCILACARLGVMHNVVFAGFSSDSLANRIKDAKSKYVITADGTFRKGKKLILKETVDESLKTCPWVETVVVLNRIDENLSMQSGRDISWESFLDGAQKGCPAEFLDSEHPLFLLYTSGSTGKPKGILHTTAGYLLGAQLSSKYVFNLNDEDIFWCTADIGWITGHTYGIYGPLSLGVSIFMYEGAPNSPDWGRFWQLIEDYKITKFYTAPTAIRAFMKYGPDLPKKYNLDSLKLLGSVGEPINPKTWLWFWEVIGQKRCPVVDTWWQTETGSIMITTLPGAHAVKPGSAGKGFFGIKPKIINEQGAYVEPNVGGSLIIEKPWPSMMRTIYGDHERYLKTYWSKIKGSYFTGDGARIDADGYTWIMGRIDDVINVSGHRLSTMEIESTLVSHPSVTEAAVVGKKDDVKGESVCCFVTLVNTLAPSNKVKNDLINHVADHIGHLAKPDTIYFTEILPKTRSGKILRRILRDIADGEEISGDLSTLEDKGVIAKIIENKINFKQIQLKEEG